MAEPQVSTLASSGSSALFLILSVGPSEADAARLREVCAMVPTLVRSIGRRDTAGGLSCVVGIGADAWDRLVPGQSRPLQLHPFRALADDYCTAPATPGDVLLLPHCAPSAATSVTSWCASSSTSSDAAQVIIEEPTASTTWTTAI
jgi:deferrochelatase/peroxidase EfeB